MSRTHGLRVALACLALAALPSASGAQSMERDAYVLPPESVQELFRRDKNIATLDRLSPDGDHFIVPKFQELTDLKLMSQRTLRLADGPDEVHWHVVGRAELASWETEAEGYDPKTAYYADLDGAGDHAAAFTGP